VFESYRKDNLAGEKNKQRCTNNCKENRTFMDAIRAMRWKMVGHALRHPEVLHYIIIEGMVFNLFCFLLLDIVC